MVNKGENLGRGGGLTEELGDSDSVESPVDVAFQFQRDAERIEYIQRLGRIRAEIESVAMGADGMLSDENINDEYQAEIRGAAREAQGELLGRYVGVSNEMDETKVALGLLSVEQGIAQRVDELTGKIGGLEEQRFGLEAGAEKVILGAGDANELFKKKLIEKMSKHQSERPEVAARIAELEGEKAGELAKIEKINAYWGMLDFPEAKYLSDEEIAEIVGEDVELSVGEWQQDFSSTVLQRMSAKVEGRQRVQGERTPKNVTAARDIIDALAVYMEENSGVGLTQIELNNLAYSTLNINERDRRAGSILRGIIGGDNLKATEYMATTYPGKVIQVGRLLRIEGGAPVKGKRPYVYRMVGRDEQDVNLVVNGVCGVQDAWGEAFDPGDIEELKDSITPETDGGSESDDGLAFLERINPNMNLMHGNMLAPMSKVKAENDLCVVLGHLQKRGVDMRDDNDMSGSGLAQALGVQGEDVMRMMYYADLDGAVGGGVKNWAYERDGLDRWKMYPNQWANVLLAQKYGKLPKETWRYISGRGRGVMETLREEITE